MRAMAADRRRDPCLDGCEVGSPAVYLRRRPNMAFRNAVELSAWLLRRDCRCIGEDILSMNWVWPILAVHGATRSRRQRPRSISFRRIELLCENSGATVVGELRWTTACSIARWLRSGLHAQIRSAVRGRRTLRIEANRRAGIVQRRRGRRWSGPRLRGMVERQASSSDCDRAMVALA